MEYIQHIKSLEKKIDEFLLVNASLDKTEKNLIEILTKLLDYFHYIIINNKKNIIYKEKDELSGLKNIILNYLSEKGYSKEKYLILDVECFNNSIEYLSTLINNLFFYFSDYIPDIDLIHIYYYLFHLNYYILLIIVESKDINLFEEENIKFYIHHITHFFKRDKKSPEYYFSFMKELLNFYQKDIKWSLNIYFL